MAKATLEAVESGIISFDAAFGMSYVLPDGRRVEEAIMPAIESAIDARQPLVLSAGRA